MTSDYSWLALVEPFKFAGTEKALVGIRWRCFRSIIIYYSYSSTSVVVLLFEWSGRPTVHCTSRTLAISFLAANHYAILCSIKVHYKLEYAYTLA